VHLACAMWLSEKENVLVPTNLKSTFVVDTSGVAREKRDLVCTLSRSAQVCLRLTGVVCTVVLHLRTIPRRLRHVQSLWLPEHLPHHMRHAYGPVRRDQEVQDDDLQVLLQEALHGKACIPPWPSVGCMLTPLLRSVVLREEEGEPEDQAQKGRGEDSGRRVHAADPRHHAHGAQPGPTEQGGRARHLRLLEKEAASGREAPDRTAADRGGRDPALVVLCTSISPLIMSTDFGVPFSPLHSCLL